ncbi:hypothetical protein [Corynebacterium timonense]|uniref:Uncharacterized protein n=1 Tax=Corynebacterium timonense TaxID=441500 RepID=A0A1H1LPY8_9CORY|nr:hypothetical protein [Corynebacterium timonense]SDR76633.1 hypothetical protein SAMN04488539_0297 [Corynebacterium timonense]
MSDNVQATTDTAQAAATAADAAQNAAATAADAAQNAAATAADAAQNAAVNATQAATATPTPANMPPQQNQGQATDAPNSVDALPEWAQNMVRDLRDENAKHRNKAKTAAEEATQREQQQAEAARNELVHNIAKALGLADEEPNPQQLLEAANNKTTEQQKQITELTEQLHSYKRDAAIADAIGDRRVNHNLLKAALHLDNGYKDIDVTSDNFTDQVSEAVNRVLDANPELVQVTRGKSGVDSNTTRNGSDPLTRDDLKTMSAEDINKAVREGRLDHLMQS